MMVLGLIVWARDINLHSRYISRLPRKPFPVRLSNNFRNVTFQLPRVPAIQSTLRAFSSVPYLVYDPYFIVKRRLNTSAMDNDEFFYGKCRARVAI